MSSKRKRNQATKRNEALSKPSTWRRQHGDFGPPSFDMDPDTGAVVTHHRAVDTLGMMLSNGTITPEMHDAGANFRMLFRSAALHRMASSSLLRVRGGAGDLISERNVDARKKIAAAIDMLGGHDSAAGSCAWHVIGLECSVREWAMRQGWRGRPVPTSQAQGMLVATLSVLAAHFGLVSPKRAA